MPRFQRPRGTRDYMPQEAWKLRLIANRIREVFELYGYGEIITPAFEHLDLLVAKAGEEVVKQIYSFRDKAGRLLGLRFEMTTPIARVIASNPMLPRPVRLYYIQPVWRYEEPQKGRYREFWQAGVELIGAECPEGDAEVVALTVRALQKAGLKGFVVKVNDRELVEGLLEEANVAPSQWVSAMRTIDKLEKRGESYVIQELAKLGLGESGARTLITRLNSLKGSIEVLSQLSSTGSERLNRGVRRLEAILSELKDGYGISNEVVIDATIVRGLDYYTSFVFEVVVPKADVGSVAGGGRYDDLIALVGGPKIPATGMAIGLERLIHAIEAENGAIGDYRVVEAVVIPVDPELRVYAARVAESLRSAGIRTMLEFGTRKLGKALERADKLGVRVAVIVGRSDIEEGVCTVRDMEKRVQERVLLDSVAEKVLSIVKSNLKSD